MIPKARAISAAKESKLGYDYYHGYGVPQSYAKATYWWKKAAVQGYSISEYNLGIMYAHGQGVLQNYVKAVYWHKNAAAQGYAPAENNLVRLLSRTRRTAELFQSDILVEKGGGAGEC